MVEYMCFDKNNEKNSFRVEFEGKQGTPFLKYIITSTDLSFDGDDDEWMDMSRIREMMGDVETWSEELFCVVKMMEGHRFKIDIGKNIEFYCIGYFEQDVIDLGKLAECYRDCDNCDKYCYSFKNESPFEDKCDCPHYHYCRDAYGTVYTEWGEEYDELWDFRCQCIKINGRDKLLKALGGKKCI